MASKATACIPLTSNGNDGAFGFGVTTEKGASGKPKWNTLRQGDSWINGLFHEQDEAANIDDSMDFSSNWRPEVDWITNEIAFQELISKEGATTSSHSDYHTFEKMGFSRRQQEHDKKLTLLPAIACWLDSGFGFHDALGSKKATTTGLGKEGIWTTDISSEGDLKSPDAIRFLPSEGESSKAAWTGENMGWYNLHTKFFEESQRSSLMVSTKCSWVEHTGENFIQDEKASREHATRFTDNCEEGKIIQELDGNRRLEETISEEILRGGKLTFQSPEGRKQGGWEAMDDNVLGMLRGNINYLEEQVTQHCSVDASRNVAKAVNDTDFCTKQEWYVSGKEFGQSDKLLMDGNCHSDRSKSGSTPPEALLYAFPYLSWHDLLRVERVCKLFRDYVRDDALLWRRFHVEPPFNKKLTDEKLLQLAARARGQLQCLSLVDCLRITEGAVEQVVRSNPRLYKLCLPGCSRISADAVLRIVKEHTARKSVGTPGLKQLRIRNIYGLTREHLDSLQSMLGKWAQNPTSLSKPQFYQNGHSSIACNDQRPIDVEACPKCGNARIVYDCTRERCQQKQGNKLQECRGCIFCIARCEECGRCINDNDYEETFCLDLLCSACWLRLPKCVECNRPGCGWHADHFIRSADAAFVCGDCCGSSSGANGPEFHVLA